MIRKWGIKDDQAKKQCIEAVLARIDEQGGTEFGMLAAEELIDIVAQYVGPAAYNTAVEDAKKTAQTKFADFEIDLDVLKTTS